MLQDRSKYPRFPPEQDDDPVAEQGVSGQRIFHHERTGDHPADPAQLRQEEPDRTGRLYGARTIALLENEGYVIKESSEADRGFCEISISPEGENVHEQLWQILEEWRMNVFKGIEPEELEQFSRTAEKYMKNIDELLGTREGASADG